MIIFKILSEEFLLLMVTIPPSLAEWFPYLFKSYCYKINRCHKTGVAQEMNQKNTGFKAEMHDIISQM